MSQDEKSVLQDRIKEQGEVVRKLKAAKAPKDEVNNMQVCSTKAWSRCKC